jgi:hypothetical protein
MRGCGFCGFVIRTDSFEKGGLPQFFLAKLGDGQSYGQVADI